MTRSTKTLVSALTFLGLAGAAAPAAAVQGEMPYRWVREGRTHRVSEPAAQEALRKGSAFQHFLRTHGPNWTAAFDEATGAPVRVWGEGIAVDPAALEDDEAAWKLAYRLLEGMPSLLGAGVAVDDLLPLVLDRSDGVTTLTFERVHRGLPVQDAKVSLRFKHGRFVVGQFETMPGVDVPTEATVSAQAARAIGVKAMDWTPTKVREVEEARLVVLPVLHRRSADHRLAWRLHLDARDRLSRRVVYVDARAGELLRWDEQLRFLSGMAAAEVDDRRPGNGLVEAPLAGVTLRADGGGSAVADAGGHFSFEGSQELDLSWGLGSQWFDLRAIDSPAAEFDDELTVDGGTVLGLPEGDDETQVRRNRAQADAHFEAHRVRAKALEINPNFWWATRRPVVRVNIDTASGDTVRCNAWFDGESINFVRQGSGCNNTARVADVVHHEYGHGFHGYNIVQGAGGWGDGSMGEGLADYMSATFFDDPLLAVGFFTGNNGPLRRIDEDRVWPDDIAGDPHRTGLIIAGALWDLRTALVQAHGYDDGVRIADNAFWHVAMRAEEIPESYVEVLLADDDDGNLANGTPNQCLIDVAFAAHGIGPSEGSTQPILVVHEPPRALPSELPVLLEAEIGPGNPACSDQEVGEVRVYWTTDATASVASFERATMVRADGPRFEVELPAQPDGAYLRYFIEVDDGAGAVALVEPFGSVTDPWYGAAVGDLRTLFEADFEESDGEFRHELVSGPDQEGADDWQWGEPLGGAGDPAFAASGSRVWGNDLAPEGWNGAYQPDIVNRLRSPAIDVSDADGPVLLQFRRWLTVEDGFYDRATIYVNGEVLWTNFASDDQQDASAHHEDFHWAFRSYDITEFVDEDDRVRIEWELASDSGLQMGGWTIDDVRIVTPQGSTGPGPGGDDDDDTRGPGGVREGELIAGEGCTCSSAATGAPGLFALLCLSLLGAVRRRVR